VKFGLRGRLILTYLILAVLGVGGLMVRFGLLETTRIIDSTEHELEIKAFTIAAAATSPLEKFGERELSYADFVQMMAKLAQTSGTRLTVLTIQGNPIYDSNLDFRSIDNQFNQVEVQSALQGSEQHQIRRDPNTGQERLYTAAPIQQEDRPKGIIQLSIPTTPMHTQIIQSWLILGGSAVAIILAIIIASLWVAHYILLPLEEMETAAHNMAAGNFNQQLTVKGNDELAQVAQAFNDMATQLNEMITKQRQFVANASHELRTPLTNIKLRAEALLDGVQDEPDMATKFLMDIEHETLRMENMTRDLLTLSRLDSANLQLHPTTFNPRTLLETVVQNLTLQAEKKVLQLMLQCPTLPSLTADSNQLRQLFENLLSNALKYTPTGGKITVTAAANATEFIFSITDNGHGIPPQDLSRIFDPFYRVDKARIRTPDPGGAGLGLSIAQRIIQAHHGQINVTSEPGQGTTFVIRLPRG